MSCGRRCKYRTPSSERGSLGYGCNYISITGHSRVKAVYEKLGIVQMTDEARKMLHDGSQCPCFCFGKRLPAGPAMTKVVIRDPERVNAPSFDWGKARGDGARFDQKKALKLWKECVPDRLIAQQLGVTKATIWSWRHRNGLGARIQPRLPDEEIRKLYEKGLTDRQIGEALGLSGMQIARWRDHRDLPVHAAERIKVDYEAVRRLYKQGLPDTRIAKEAHCHPQSVQRWRIQEGLPPNGNRRK